MKYDMKSLLDLLESNNSIPTHQTPRYHDRGRDFDRGRDHDRNRDYDGGSIVCQDSLDSSRDLRVDYYSNNILFDE